MLAAEDLQRPPKIYKSKPASELLAPYLTYLEVHPPAVQGPVKQREGRQAKGQTRSALAFRVREGSVRTLQKELAKVREREERRGRKRQQFELAKTLDSKIQREGQFEREKFIRDLEARVKKRVESRQIELESLRKTTMEQPQLSMYKISTPPPTQASPIQFHPSRTPTATKESSLTRTSLARTTSAGKSTSQFQTPPIPPTPIPTLSSTRSPSTNSPTPQSTSRWTCSRPSK
jgi:hypothetical protein